MTVSSQKTKLEAIFLCAGLILAIFSIVVIAIFRVFIGTLLFLFFIIPLPFCILPAIRLLRGQITKSHALKSTLRRVSALGIFGLFVFSVFISNPLYWPAQIARHTNPSLFITPDAPTVIALNDTDNNDSFWTWLENTQNISVSDALNSNVKDILPYAEDYVNNYRVPYKFIHENYGVIDYVATPTEALERWGGDCQQQTAVLVSLLRLWGFEAYASETPFHWFTRIYLHSTQWPDSNVNQPNTGTGEVFELYRINTTEPIWVLNDQGVLFTADPFFATYHIATYPRLNGPFATMLLGVLGEGFGGSSPLILGPALGILVVVSVFIIVGCIVSIFSIAYTSNEMKDRRKTLLKTVGFSGIMGLSVSILLAIVLLYFTTLFLTVLITSLMVHIVLVDLLSKKLQ